ncbi:MAG: hypothetical protein MJZ67_06805 [Bacteroidales bacterium]|nr:hypothetical protein [Bacteroidales bacterium]
MVILLTISCKGEQKIATYEDLYKEQTITILVAPVQDNTKRPPVKTTQDQVLNDELTLAAHYLRQSCGAPLVSRGYYVIPTLASDIILAQKPCTYRQLSLDNIQYLSADYGIDAVLLVAIHKWEKPEVNEVVSYVEYTLRSTKSGLELMHCWIRGDKMQPVNEKGEPIELATDNEFISRTQIESRLAHRCILLEQMSDFALRNVPTASSRWMYQKDSKYIANPAFYGFVINPDGSIERTEYNEDAFGNECFTTD